MRRHESRAASRSARRTRIALDHRAMANLQHLTPVDRSGRVRAILESPQGSKNKLKYVPGWNAFEVGASLPAGLSFPFDFGFLPGTLAADGDPLDILVLMDAPAYPGCVVAVRLLGAIEAEQRVGDGPAYRNDRLIGLAEGSTQRGDPHRLADLDDHLLDEIEAFFTTYDGLRGKAFKALRRVGPDAARGLLDRARTHRRPEARADAMNVTAPARRRRRIGPGLAPVAIGHPAVLPHPAFDGWAAGPEADAPLPDAARERFASLGDDLRASVRKVRRGLDAEDVHDLRVAARRLEVTVGEFAGVLDVRDRRTLVDELERLSKRLGDVRDLDVLLDNLSSRWTARRAHPASVLDEGADPGTQTSLEGVRAWPIPAFRAGAAQGRTRSHGTARRRSRGTAGTSVAARASRRPGSRPRRAG